MIKSDIENIKDVVSLEYACTKFLPYFESATPQQVASKRSYLKQTSQYDLLHFEIAESINFYLQNK